MIVTSKDNERSVIESFGNISLRSDPLVQPSVCSTLYIESASSEKKAFGRTSKTEIEAQHKRLLFRIDVLKELNAAENKNPGFPRMSGHEKMLLKRAWNRRHELKSEPE
ncbi:hypothetical protein [Roseinatronobacter sp.]|uniref:hypothetical protein n=1 Tax=Roseinatronobacter sp. TaxID=1945755 RepID=UPI0025F14ED1|nr:hypothetical protein [Roseibaca sp.]